ncbi:multicopper oxidase domain-containing protein [Roseomonas populi]|uniref:Multicopper oxidase domain-containing protein n=1 Tax=Roseomonas populi TaxID=3121582 RepID=A0ABT1XAY1_9PROT|nr:multicopper oxidase domain-containing protein [Roseomonas pecuniae]MCR0984139.1 multicopper oxidase domain-containing protein [Roseomonas pecuniae]
MAELSLPRRSMLAAGIAAIAAPALSRSALAQPVIGRMMPREFNLAIEHVSLNITGSPRSAIAVNRSVPAPVLRFREGEEVVINVANRLRESTSIHWHGLILPSGQDGVPGISDGFQGIAAGETHQYRFPLVQAGTYWYHSHSGTQEQAGLYGPLVIDPARAEPFGFDRDYIIQLSDWTDENPHRVIQNLKRDAGYYNYNKRTAASLANELARAPNAQAREAIIRDRMMWGEMRMDPTDIEDVTGYTFLVNGRTPEQNFTAAYRPGETVRLRFINSGAMSHFDVRIPGLEMTVVQAHGNNVQPVAIDEFRIAPAETFDVLVRPTGGRQFQILAESMGRQGFASASLATQNGLPMLPLPSHRERPLLTMADMGGNYGPRGLDRGTLRPETDRPGQIAPMESMDMGGMDHSGMPGMSGMGSGGAQGGMQGMDHSNMPGMNRGAPAPAGRGGRVQAPSGTAPMDHSTMPGMDHSNMPGMGRSSSLASDPMFRLASASIPSGSVPGPGNFTLAQATRGQGGMSGMDHSNMPGMDHSTMPGMDHSGMPGMGQPQQARPTQPRRPQGQQNPPAPRRDQRSAAPAAPDHSAMGHGAPGTGQVGQVDTSAASAHAGHGGMTPPDPFAVNTGAPPGARVLTYRMLRALSNPYPVREPDRILEVRLTGNMERYFWAINGNRFSEAQPIVLTLGERVRMRFINETMMSHPMHLHGVWMQPQVGNGAQNPLLHTISVKPGSTLDVDVEADAEGGWAFHCHMLFHMETGMMRKVEIRRQPRVASNG